MAIAPTIVIIVVSSYVCGGFTLSKTHYDDNKDILGYYWRDYDGTIPYDAIPGGVDKAGRTTYIGQIVHSETVLHPGQVHPLYENITYSYDGTVFTKTKIFKVLCCGEPNKFKWIKTNTNDIRFLLPTKHLVIAGYSGGYPLLAGRAVRKDQIIVGKVTIREAYEGIGFVENNRGVYEKVYEVLSYNNECEP